MPLSDPLLDALERMSCGGLIIDGSGTIIRLNPSGTRLLAEQAGTAVSEIERRGSAENALNSLLRAGSPHFSVASDSWFIVPRENGRQIILRVIPLRQNTPTDPKAVIVLIDLQASPKLLPGTVERIFGLTAAEANVAVEISQGRSLTQIAEAQRLSMTTARAHLAGILAKTNTRRQGELIALLTRIALLP